MNKIRELPGKNVIVIPAILVLSLAATLLFSLYMGLPRKGTISDCRMAESESYIEEIKQKGRVTTITGWFLVRKQDSSRQLRKELVLSSPDKSYSYPVRYIDRPDVAEAYGSIYGRAGFEVQVSSRFVGKGSYRLYIRYLYSNSSYAADLKKEIALQ